MASSTHTYGHSNARQSVAPAMQKKCDTLSEIVCIAYEFIILFTPKKIATLFTKLFYSFFGFIIESELEQMKLRLPIFTPSASAGIHEGFTT
ncbi:hypothetical protein BBEV_2052 [Salisediminibacterium beveridgei]|uniref:Uncharacterized protein n=1 Tax=Salisediminibacterium beveridgei TaxID=632773 RepID=A0A1D7QWN4_9BACI|nr:hypothetical protein BBEV_2052 [Salisediminibacterium beveridgei]